MQITQEELLAEAQSMALEVRLLKRQIAGLTAENEQLRREAIAETSVPGE